MFFEKRFCLIFFVLLLSIGQVVQAVQLFDDFSIPHNYLTDGVAGTKWDGFVGLDEGQTVDNLNASIDQAGQLFIQSTGARWEPDWDPLGPFLYKEIYGDFIATVKVTGFAGCPTPAVYHNDCGLMARVPELDDAGSGEDAMTVQFFATWSGNLYRIIDNGAESELGVTGDGCSAAQYLQIERIGDDFYCRISDNGVDWMDLAGSAVQRSDMSGLPVQVGMWQCTYSDSTGYAAFDDFTLIYKAGVESARDPQPTDAAENVPINTNLSWTAGEKAQDVNGHHIYIGSDFDDVYNAEFNTHPNVNLYIVSDPCCDVGQLTMDHTYYWRADEVNDPQLWKGEVWSFSTETGKATSPIPADGATNVDPNAVLVWSPSSVAASHDVYFGTNEAAVMNASRSAGDVFKGNQLSTTFNPGALDEAVEYFWRIDEVNEDNVFKGDIWRFTTTQTTGYYHWPQYSPTIAYDYQDEYGTIDPPTQVLNDVSGVAGTYADGWWCFRWGVNKNALVTEADWIPMIERLNEDFAYITDVMRWPRDKRAREGYYSTAYLYGSGLSTDNASNNATGGWQGTTWYNRQAWPMILASYYPVHCFDPSYTSSDKEYQTGAMVHEGIHCILSSMPGCTNSCWFQEGGNTWLQGTMEGQRSGDFSSIGWLSAGGAIAPFMPIECYSGWLQDDSFGGPCAEGVNMNRSGQQICTWRNLLGGTQYGECFPHAMEVILGPKSIAWLWRNCHYSGRVLQDLAEAPGGLGEVQIRRLIQEYRARQAFCDFGQWSYAFRKLLNDNWNVAIGAEWSPYWIDCDRWYATCYVETTQEGSVLTPEYRTLPGWSGANQIPLAVGRRATEATIEFNPIGENMSCQLVYRDNNGNIHYSAPVNSGACSIPLANVMNNVIVAVICNTDYIYYGESTRTAKYDYTLTMGAGVAIKADIYTKWFDYNPSRYTITSSAGANGTVSPSGAISVIFGGSRTFTFNPDTGYHVDQVVLNGLPIGALDSYTFKNVRGNHSISVTFAESEN